MTPRSRRQRQRRSRRRTLRRKQRGGGDKPTSEEQASYEKLAAGFEGLDLTEEEKVKVRKIVDEMSPSKKNAAFAVIQERYMAGKSERDAALAELEKKNKAKMNAALAALEERNKASIEAGRANSPVVPLSSLYPTASHTNALVQAAQNRWKLVTATEADKNARRRVIKQIESRAAAANVP